MYAHNNYEIQAPRHPISMWLEGDLQPPCNPEALFLDIAICAMTHKRESKRKLVKSAFI